MKNTIEIRWHARGGQGAKTASLLFAEAMLELGKYIQAFPDYGPERTGAPIRAYNRISNKPIRNYSAVTSPDMVIVLDPTLLKNPNTIVGIKEDGVIIINTEKKVQEIKSNLGVNNKIITVPASKISLDILGKNIPNTVMLGALVKALDLEFKELQKGLKTRLLIKFRKKSEYIKKNLKAIEQAYKLS
ncbi:pyruvate synthase [bacterium CG_4_10_14_0_2_um_filter_33_32]|nr:MAG: hypothetical protein AUJ93_04720 [bacterium CG2_30_33_46]PIR67508.1 MAG: pyruvate synthase [bacterium CG10_big_fil_rev_8_21_14_0_10_33_18]PIU76262.1 MAG: pyruvate synthase [bacterium CG06_land_8_20_14_3_00_33_50]PIW81534.1 MAG: pyruvate synthase [bacterium CG_4_8_14_3_um_filter_33_28]PIY85773.1 MAG: pyruvate synthase [bacterium CG_4_10_14_0_8_um_filter_33_57]PIZ85643.1 MAG: pyruvate synthase [bacterium CG_4_10_14_0_2_um_filter_33_32]PJA71986.1 MAG: pyruvate synthase [bacterium CG_4_9_